MKPKLAATRIIICLLCAAFLFVSGCNDDSSPTDPENRDPVIQSVTASPSTVATEGTTNISCIATDEDGDDLTYSWSSQQGNFPNGVSGSSIQWQAPSESGNYSIAVTVSDGTATDQDFINVNVEQSGGGNQPPNAPSNPTPAHQATNQSININLSWFCSDPDGDTLMYDVYFGALEDPPRIASDQVDRTIDPGNLNNNTTYFWKIVAKDNQDHTTEGSVWSFTTRQEGGGGGEPGEERDFDLANGATITMVWIPAGSFMMGRQDGEQDSYDSEDPRHEVNINYGFWMGKYEVTQAQWEAVTGSNPSGFDGNDRPVEQVSWDAIHEDFLTRIDGDFRLPSESEWEYACRADTDTRFYWGDDDDPDYDQIGDYAWYWDNSNEQTHDVGQKRPNTFGLYDMSGNVWEWCEDWYHNNYEGAPDDGSAWDDNGSYRVLRGGSWNSNPRYCRSASRSRNSPNGRNYHDGLRLVLVR